MHASSASPVFRSQTTTFVDSNTNVNTVSLDIQGTRDVSLHVIGVLGSHATHIITLQASADNASFVNTSTTITGTGIVEAPMNAKYIRARVTTVEGGSSQVDIIFNVK